VSSRDSEPDAEQDITSLATAVIDGNRRALAQAITLIESTRRDHRARANALLELVMPHTGNSIRLGISGVPGVGKSTFIEALGNYVIDAGHRPAVLTVDPSSAISGGSILGDKTRMEQLSRRSEAFIRPSPAGKTLGGVTRRSREALILCEAAGFDVIIVETVGVGQSETRVAEMTDMFVLLLLPGAGDELQGIKRGIVELADLILINKSDDNLVKLAGQAAAEYRNALRLLHPRSANWTVQVECCSARDGDGIAEAWEVVLKHHEMLESTGLLIRRRAEQARDWMWSDINDDLVAALRGDPEVRKQIPLLEAAASEGRIPPTVDRPFRVLGIQQIAVGGLDKDRLRKLWIDTLGLELSGTYQSESENVDEDIAVLGTGPLKVEVDLMQPLDPDRKPSVQTPPLNHIGLWIDDLPAAVEWLQAQGVRFAPGGIRKGASGFDICFMHPKGNEEFPISGEGVLIELVQAPPDVREAFA
jgi:LAO/AO transport system kinase